MTGSSDTVDKTMTGPVVIRGSEQPEYWFREGCYITEWSNADQDPGLSVARARVEPGWTTRRHALEGIVERYVILAGTGEVELGGLPAIEVGAGDVAVIPAGTPQRIRNRGDDDLVFLAVCTPRFQSSRYVDLEDGSNGEDQPA